MSGLKTFGSHECEVEVMSVLAYHPGLSDDSDRK